jgi:hypothetical protein
MKERHRAYSSQAYVLDRRAAPIEHSSHRRAFNTDVRLTYTGAHLRQACSFSQGIHLTGVQLSQSKHLTGVRVLERRATPTGHTLTGHVSHGRLDFGANDPS